MFEKPVYERIFEAARPFLQTRHNEIHTRICLRFALRLLQDEGGDADVVVPGVILHDVGWSAVPESLQLSAFGPKMTNPDLRDVHEREGAVIAREILATVLYPSDKVEQIITIVSRHDSRLDGEFLEERIVKDADKLWRVSREGCAVDPGRFEMSPADHLSRLRGALDRWFLTRAGKRMAWAELAARELDLTAGQEGGVDLAGNEQAGPVEGT